MTADDDLRRAAQEVADAFPPVEHPATPRGESIERLRAALAARSEPRAEGLQLDRWIDSLTEDANGTVWVTKAELRSVLLAATPPAEGLDVERPEIIVLCGSTRFYDEFQAANYDLTMLGKIVLSVGFYPHSKALHGHGEGVGHDSSEKVALDELHKRKIDLADRVYVLNVNGYIGDSTRSEIEYAERLGKPIDYLEAIAPEQPE